MTAESRCEEIVEGRDSATARSRDSHSEEADLTSLDVRRTLTGDQVGP